MAGTTTTSSPHSTGTQPQLSPTSFFCSPRMDRESSCSSDLSNSSSSDETEIATPPVLRVEEVTSKAAGLTFDRSNNTGNGNGTRAHYRTTDMLQFEGRQHPNQVWICNRKPSSPLPGYVATPSVTPGLDGGSTQNCYFATAAGSSSSSLASTSTQQQQHHPNCLHLGLRPSFIHSDTVPDVHDLVHHDESQRAKNRQKQLELRQENLNPKIIHSELPKEGTAQPTSRKGRVIANYLRKYEDPFHACTRTNAD
ncbi:hypothetical protein P389DRAFT_191003 [Cystobasidium minutum MCA 4210]|uniref:uncharacterized protein n=1 Tax=Cystobasidium minutum MCA 4210 TaxID=1397322 RepID=UPI0034CDBF24|eukprot:jgi/Rhomi1/191003/estExt_fgenesh1_pg.C_60325